MFSWLKSLKKDSVLANTAPSFDVESLIRAPSKENQTKAWFLNVAEDFGLNSLVQIMSANFADTGKVPELLLQKGWKVCEESFDFKLMARRLVQYKARCESDYGLKHLAPEFLSRKQAHLFERASSKPLRETDQDKIEKFDLVEFDGFWHHPEIEGITIYLNGGSSFYNSGRHSNLTILMRQDRRVLYSVLMSSDKILQNSGFGRHQSYFHEQVETGNGDMFLTAFQETNMRDSSENLIIAHFTDAALGLVQNSDGRKFSNDTAGMILFYTNSSSM
jgi:hypothetical protein